MAHDAGDRTQSALVETPEPTDEESERAVLLSLLSQGVNPPIFRHEIVKTISEQVRRFRC